MRNWKRKTLQHAGMELAPADKLALLVLAATTAVTASELLSVKTRIIQLPPDIEVAAGTTAVFRCNAVVDPILGQDFQWLFNGEPVDFEEHPRLVLLNDSTLAVNHTTVLDSGVYTCVANASGNNDRANANLIVQDVPNPPKVLRVVCERDSALLQWMPGDDNRAPVLSYAVQFNTSFNPDTWKNAVRNIPATDTEVKLSLSPWTNYTFQVMAHNKIGPSPPSHPSSAMCATPEDVPYKNPEGVFGRGDRPDNLVIGWTPMSLIDHNAPGLFYKVHWKRLNPLDKSWSSHIVKDWMQNRHVVYKQPVFTPYKIRVEAHNRRGQAKTLPAEVVGYSGEDVPLAEPKNFLLLQIFNSTSAEFRWSPVSDESVRGYFRGYKIQTWPRNEGEESLKELTVPANHTTAKVSLFKPYSWNVVRILAFNDKYNGPPSGTIEFTTPEGTPGPVADLKGISVGSTGFYLAWKQPLQPNGVLIGYNIYYQEVIGTELEPERQQLPPVRDPLQTRASLTGLKPNTSYRITVQAATWVGPGDCSFIELRTADRSGHMPNAPDFVWVLTPDGGGKASIKVTWVPSTSGHLGSDYYVQYRRKGDETWHRIDLDMREENALLTGLEADSLYELRVLAVDGTFESASRIEEVHTGGIRQ